MRRLFERFLMWRSDVPGNGLFAGLRWRLKGLVLRSQPHLRVRYAPVLRHVKATRKERYRVLEVGAGSLGITRFWRRPVVGVDLSFDGPKLQYLVPVEASAESLPFGDRSFDLVISVDMLEHLSPDVRRRAIEEMLRVSAGEVLVGVPCGPGAERCESWARSRCDAVLGEDLPPDRRKQIERRAAFLSEHAECGLPTESELRSIVDEWAARAGSAVGVRTFGNEPLWYWRLALPGIVPLAPARTWPSRLASIAAQPLLSLLPSREAYRTFFQMKKSRAERASDAARESAI